MSPAPVLLDLSSNNQHVGLADGQSIRIHLPGNPTTGYTWLRKGAKAVTDDDASAAPTRKQSMSCENLQVSGLYKSADGGASGVVGGDGIFEVVVSAKRPGAHTLEMIYARPWDTEGTVAKSFTIYVDAK